MTAPTPLAWIVHLESVHAGDYVYPAEASAYVSPGLSDADAMLLCEAIAQAERWSWVGAARRAGGGAW